MEQHTCPLCGCDGIGRVISAGDVAYRFWSKVDVRGPDDCWEWRGSRSAFGHGRFRVPSAVPELGGKARTAHRVAYWLHNGAWPADDQVVRHTCDNPPCVNPAHLLLGTHADNAMDKISRGRQPPNQNAGKTHCKRGHEFTPENTGRNMSTGGRYCKECHRKRVREWARQQRKASSTRHGHD